MKTVSSIVALFLTLSTVEAFDASPLLATIQALSPSGIVAPTDLSGCVLWLDYSDASTLYDTYVGDNPTPADGVIGLCKDKSGHECHSYTVEADYKPLRKDAGINGHRAALFDSNDYTTWSPPTASNPCTLFVVHKYSGVSTYVPFTAGGSTYFYVASSGSSDTIIASGSGTLSYRLNGSAANWSTRGDVYTALEGIAAVVTVEGFNAGLWTHDWHLHGYIGASPNGYVGEVVVYSRALNATERSQVETYLKSKWGI